MNALNISSLIDRNDVPDLKELKKMCAAFPITVLVSKYTGEVSFEACAGTALDNKDGKYKKLRRTFGVVKYGDVQTALASAKTWLKEMNTANREEKSTIISIPPRIRPLLAYWFEWCEQNGFQFNDLCEAGKTRLLEEKVKREVTFSFAAARVLEAKAKDKSDVYQADLKTLYKSFGTVFGETKLHEITVDDIEDWLEEREVGPVTYNNYRRNLGVLWSFALEARNGWVKHNVAAQVPQRDIKTEEVTALTIDQAAGILRAAHYNLPRLLPYLAVSMFCGLRRSEVQQADWSDIDWETGSMLVRGGKMGSVSSRYVHLEPVTINWLKPLAQPGGPICTGKHVRREDLDKLRAMTFNFDGNIFRHSFGSNHYHGFKNPSATIVEMGHTTPQMLHKHYRRPVPQATAMQYWALTREKVLNSQ